MTRHRPFSVVLAAVLLLAAVFASSGTSPSLALTAHSTKALALALWEQPHTASAYAMVREASSARIVQLDESSLSSLTASLERLESPSSYVVSASWSQPLVSPSGTSSTPSDPRFSAQWALSALDLPAVWPSYDGTGQTIALTDTGFSGSAELPRTTPGRNWVLDAGHPTISDTADSDGHGTATATIAAAAADGTGMVGAAPGATVMPLRVLGNSGSGTSSDLASAIIYAADQNVRVLSMSIGVYGSDSTLSAAISYAATRGVLMVAAAGNGGPSASPPLPASDDNTIAVAATDSSQNPASFSQTGSFIDLAAPGVFVTGLSSDGSYYSWSGTSMATPLVAGLAAILFEAHPGATASQVRQALIASATDVYTPGVDTRTGAGIPSASAALAALSSLITGPTTTTTTPATSSPPPGSTTTTTAPSTTSPTTTTPTTTTPTTTTPTTTTPTTTTPTTTTPTTTTTPPVTAPPLTFPPSPEPPAEPPSTPTTSMPLTPPPPPASLKLSVYGSDVLISWPSVASASRYVVARDGVVLSRPTDTFAKDAFRALVPGVYSYAVYAEDASGLGSLPVFSSIAVEKISAPRLNGVSVSSRTLTVRLTLPRIRPAGTMLYVYVDGRVALRVTPATRVRLKVSRGKHTVKLQLVSPRGASAPSKSRSVRVR